MVSFHLLITPNPTINYKSISLLEFLIEKSFDIM